MDRRSASHAAPTSRAGASPGRLVAPAARHAQPPLPTAAAASNSQAVIMPPNPCARVVLVKSDASNPQLPPSPAPNSQAQPEPAMLPSPAARDSMTSPRLASARQSCASSSSAFVEEPLHTTTLERVITIFGGRRKASSRIRQLPLPKPTRSNQLPSHESELATTTSRRHTQSGSETDPCSPASLPSQVQNSPSMPASADYESTLYHRSHANEDDTPLRLNNLIESTYAKDKMLTQRLLDSRATEVNQAPRQKEVRRNQQITLPGFEQVQRRMRKASHPQAAPLQFSRRSLGPQRNPNPLFAREMPAQGHTPSDEGTDPPTASQT